MSGLERFNLKRIEKVKLSIRQQQTNGTQRWYEIFVDNIKAVDKTEDLNCFDNYKDLVDEDTENIRIVVYYSPHSPRNEPYIFPARKEDSSDELSGINNPEVRKAMEQQLAAQRVEFEWIQKESDYQRQLAGAERNLKDLQLELEEAEDLNEKLKKEVEEYKSGAVEKQVNLGRMLAAGAEALLVRNAAKLSRVPLLGTLASVFSGTKQQQLSGPPEEGSEMSFEMSEEGQSPLAPWQQSALAWYEDIKKELNPEQSQAFFDLGVLFRRHPWLTTFLLQQAVQAAAAERDSNPESSTVFST